MNLSKEPYKGTRDFFPAEMRFRNWMFNHLRTTVESYGFEEYQGPMLESFDLYAAKSGEEIVNRQLYWLTDQGGRKLAVRPEMTPTLARMVAQKFHETPKPIRWFSIPNLWRQERPQRGRLREHWQLNVDVLGGDALKGDVEILSVARDLIARFSKTGSASSVVIRVNHRGLMDQFFGKELGLDAGQTLRVVKAIDAKDKVEPTVFSGWLRDAGVTDAQESKLLDFFKSNLEQAAEIVPGPSVDHLSKVIRTLKTLDPDFPVIFDPTIMRGLDYYTGMVFEIYDTHPENRRAMFGGGRYDNLVGLFGKDSISGIGFGMGDVSLENFLEVHGLKPELSSGVDVFVSLPSDAFWEAQMKVSKELREAGFRVVNALEASSFGSQLKHANKIAAHFVVLFGDEEWKRGEVVLKNLKSGTQESVSVSELVQSLKTISK